MPTLNRNALTAHVRRCFPDREFILRSDGEVRFIRLSTLLQVRIAVLLTALAAAWLAALVWIGASAILASGRHDDLTSREARVANAETRVSAYRQDIGRVADEVARRQAFLEALVKTHVGDLPADASADSADRISAALPKDLPGAMPLARIEARQLAFADALTRLADRRAAAAETTIRKLGLDPAALAARGRREGMGGPLQRLATSAEGLADPRFRRLGLSLARMAALQQGLAGIPQVEPAGLHTISSSFGYRTDPIAGGAAFHAGLDFRGPVGAPIHAAAQGTVSFVGQKGAYGNCVEITHGNGVVTRYAHMSAFRTRVGQKVAPGAVIGAIGNTGRSTGPHLHFEVRINDVPVNPRPFLEVAPHVHEKARGPVRDDQH